MSPPSAEVGDDLDGAAAGAADQGPWLAFGDLMAGLLGAFVLVVVALVASQLDLSEQLAREQEQRQAEEQRRLALEQALAGPLASGRVTFENGRIGISGSVLFPFNSDRLQPEGRQLLRSLAGPLNAYLNTRDELLMISGFTDDRQVLGANRRFEDNWELSAQRALTVTRELIDAGLSPTRVFAAAFGAQQPVASNDDARGRALNRRVEIAPTPRRAAATAERP